MHNESTEHTCFLSLPKPKNSTDHIRNNLFTASMMTPLSTHISGMKKKQQKFNEANKSNTAKKCLARQKSFEKSTDKNITSDKPRISVKSDSEEEETLEMANCVVQAQSALERVMKVISKKSMKKSSKLLIPGKINIFF